MPQHETSEQQAVRVRANVERMRSQGASEDLVRTYLQQETAQEVVARAALMSPREARNITARRGITLGLSPKLAGVLSAIQGKGFQAGQQAEQRQLAEAEEVGGLGAMGTELLAGLIPLAVPGVGRVLGGARTGSTVLRAARAGGLLGASYGLGGAEGTPAAQGVQTAVGAGTGAIGGGLLGLLGMGAAKGGAAIARKFGIIPKPGPLVGPSVEETRLLTAGNLAQRTATEAGPNSGERLILRSMAHDKIAPADALQRVAAIRASGIEPALVDVLGPNARSRVDLAAARSGEAKTAIGQAVEERAGTMRADLANAAQRAAGRNPTTAFSRTQDIIAAREAQAQPAFEAAREAAQTRFPEGFIAHPSVIEALAEVGAKRPGAIRYAKDIAKLRDFPTERVIQDPDLTRALGIKGSIVRLPSLQYAHAVKEGLDRGVMAEQRAVGRVGKTRFAGETALKAKLRDAVTEAIPEYGTALEQFRGQSEMLRAAQAASRLWVAGTDPEVIAQQVARMSPGEQEVFRDVGLAGLRAFVQSGNRAPLAPTITNAWWNNPAWQAKLQLVIPDDAGRQQFMQAIGATRTKMQNQAAGAGSLTYQRGAAQEEAIADLLGSLARPSGDIPVGSLARGTFRTIYREGQKVVLGKALDEASPMLMAQGPALDEVLKRFLFLQGARQPPRIGPVAGLLSAQSTSQP